MRPGLKVQQIPAKPARLAPIALALSCLLGAGVAGAAQVKGRLVDAVSGKPAAGAEVRVANGNGVATTDRDGNFVINDVPSGPATLIVRRAGLQEETITATAADTATSQVHRIASTQAVERIVVTGQREADQSSLLSKRDAASNVEVVTADDVGKLVDKNVAEAVSRLPGISVSTDKGEARYLVIRGLEPSLANVTINNQTSAAPEPESRQVKLDDVPSSLIGAVTVVKSLTPDLDANAIAGQIDIKTLSAFDKRKPIFSVRAIGGKMPLFGDKSEEGDVTIGGLFGENNQFGAVVAYTRSRRPSGSEDLIATGDVAWQTISGVEVPISFDARIYDPAKRTREGLVANFDWRPNAEVKAYLRFLDSKFDDNEVRNRYRFLFPTAASGYSNLTQAGGTILGARGERYVRLRNEITETKTLSLGGEFQWGPGQLSVQATQTRATKEDPIRDEFRYRTGSSTLSGSFTLGSELFDFTTSALAQDPTRFVLNTYRAQFRHAKEDLQQFRADYEWPVESWGGAGAVKFGVKHIDRDKVNDQSGRSYTYTGSSFNLSSATTAGSTGFFANRYLFGPYVNYGLSRAFFDGNPTAFSVDNAATLSDSLAADYAIREKVSAAYVMATYNPGKLTVIPGIRVERTTGNFKAIAITPTSTLNDTYNSLGSSRYSDWFPSINAKYEFSRQLQGRAAITTAIGRPDYDKIAPTVSVDTASNAVTRGNPDLKALSAINLDASLEYYFPDMGGIAVGVFSKRIKDPIFVSTTTGSGTFAGVTLTNASITQPRNGNSSKLHGLEINFQKPLTFLPSPLDGFGVNANITLVKGEISVPGRSDKLPLFLQPKRIGSLQMYYEKYGLAARLAYTYQSEYLEFVGSAPRGDIYNGEQGILSARFAYNFTKEFQVFAEGNNLNNHEDYRYAQTRSRLVETERYGRTYRVGFTYSY
ncbi:MAG: TonB-dependent receptor [Betaproteobacteria bacterium]|nr:TonB-dependent receptor [Betaproteobacteria bacterium]